MVATRCLLEAAVGTQYRGIAPDSGSGLLKGLQPLQYIAAGSLCWSADGAAQPQPSGTMATQMYGADGCDVGMQRRNNESTEGMLLYDNRRFLMDCLSRNVNYVPGTPADIWSVRRAGGSKIDCCFAIARL